MSKPKLICMTPVRNEAWVLHAFLKSTSLWADYIIIADQNSTDDSKKIASEYPKVILITNNTSNYNEAERQRLLINKAREIKGDKILFGLDADEIFSANFSETDDWQKILNSQPGDVFWFKWAEILPNQKEYWESPTTYFPWMFHDDNKEPHKNYVRNMHSMRIPYPIEENQMFYVNDFKVLHLAYLDINRTNAKRRYYKLIDWQLNKWSPVSLSRSYAQTKKDHYIFKLPDNFIYTKKNHNFYLFENINCTSQNFWFDQIVLEEMQKQDLHKIKKIDLWDKEFVEKYQVNDPRNIFDKIIHIYFRKTQYYSKNIIILIIDRLLKKMY